MAETRDILWRFLGDAKGLDRASKQATGALGKTKKGMSGVTKAAGAMGVAFGGAKILDFAGDALQASLAAGEAAAKFDTVFESVNNAAEAVDEWSTKAGVADAAANDLWGTAGNLAQAMGFTEEASLALTEEIANLSADLSSFNDTDPAETFRNLQKAVLTTEREGVKPLGLAITELEVKSRSLAIAQGDGRDAATKQDRALASLQIATEQAGKAVGDLDRTFDSAANRQRRMIKATEDLKVAIGDVLQPAFEAFLTEAEKFVGSAPKVAAGLKDIGGGAEDAQPELEFLAKWSEKLGKQLLPLTSISNNVGDAWRYLEERGERAIAGMNDFEDGGRRAAAAAGDLADKVQRAGLNAEVAAKRAHFWTEELTEQEIVALANKTALDGINAALQQYHHDAETAAEAAINLRLALNPPKVGGGTGGSGAGSGGVSQQHSGGRVPGAPGTTQMALLQGGEEVIRRGAGGGGGPTVNVYMGVVGDPYEAARVVAELLSDYETLNGARLDRVTT